MKMTKRLLALVLTVVMLIGTVPMGAFAASDSLDTAASVVSEAETADTTVASNNEGYTAATAEEATAEDAEAQTYEITYTDPAHGSVSGALFAAAGDTVDLTVTADEGYILDEVIIRRADGYGCEYKNGAFEMPAQNVSITVSFRSIVGEVEYIDADGERQTALATEITADDTTLTGGWYALKEHHTFDERMILQGNVNIILCSNSYLEAVKGITVADGANVTFYEGSRDAGVVRVTDPDDGLAGIGGGSEAGSGTLTINGSFFDVVANGNGTAIGSSLYAKCDVTINGGNVSAANGGKGAGIGNSYNTSDMSKFSGTVTVNGGIVSCESAQGDALGGFYETVVINDGTVTATAKGAGTGIGSFAVANITINGGNVTATGGTNAAGIGASDWGGNYTITINGGTVSATAGEGAAAIGSGKNWLFSGTIAINGGHVRAIADEAGSNGIGDGNRDNPPEKPQATLSLNWSDKDNFSLYVKGKTTFAANTELKEYFGYGTENNHYAPASYDAGLDMPSGETLVPYTKKIITCKSVSHGTVSSDVDKAWPGDTVTLNAAPDIGYTLKKFTVTDTNNQEIEVTADNTFIMPASDVTVQAEFVTKSYHIFVGGVAITGQNYSDVLGDGTVSYDPQKNHLTLNNAHIEATGNDDNKEYGILIAENSEKSVHIKLIGENTITNAQTQENTTAVYGILGYGNQNAYYIDGNGSLDISMEAADEKLTYTGIEIRDVTTLVECKAITVRLTGTAKAIGWNVVGNCFFSVLSKALVSLYTEGNAQSYALVSNADRNIISVSSRGTLETIGKNAAMQLQTDFTDATKYLEILVGTQANRASAALWDRETSLNNYHYVNISDRTTGYVLTCTQSECGAASADKYLVQQGDRVTLTFTPAAGYKMYSYDVNFYNADGSLQNGYTHMTYYENVTTYELSINGQGGKGQYIVVTPSYRATHRIIDKTDGLLQYRLSFNADESDVGLEGERVFVQTVDYVSEKQCRIIEQITVTDAEGNTVNVNLGSTSADFVMPASDVTVTAKVSNVKYHVNTNYDSRDDAGSIRFISDSWLEPGEICTMQEVKSSDDYELIQLYYEDEDGNRVNLMEGNAFNPDTGIYSFRMPAKPVTVYRIYQVIAGFSKIRFSDECFAAYSLGVIDLEPNNNKTIVAEGADVTLRVEVKNEQYGVKSLYYVDENGQKVDLMPDFDKTTGLFTFTMPESDITITFTFEPVIKLLFPEVEGGKITADTDKVLQGDTVILTAYPEAGYKLYSYDCTVYNADGTYVTSYTYFTYSKNDTVYPYTIHQEAAVGRYIELKPNYKPTHKIIDATGGDLVFYLGSDKDTTDVGIVGERVYLEAKDYNYRKHARTFENITVTDAQGNVVELSGSSTNKNFEMPDSDVTVSATISNLKYWVDTDYNPSDDIGYFRFENRDMLFEPGETVIASEQKYYDYYQLADLYYEDEEGNRTDLFENNYNSETGVVSFVMPAKAIKLCKQYVLKQGYYKISIDEQSRAFEQGRVYLYSKSVQQEGEAVQLHVDMRDSRYAISSLYYIDSADNRVDLMPSYNKEDGSFSFTMPASDITLYYDFSRIYTANFSYYYVTEKLSLQGFAGEAIDFSLPLDEYVLEHVELSATEFWGEDANGNKVDIDIHWDAATNQGTLVMPAQDITVVALYYAYNELEVGTYEHGTVTVDRDRVLEGDTAVITVHPDKGWIPTEVYQSIDEQYVYAEQDASDGNIWYFHNPVGWLPADKTIKVTFEHDPNYHTAKFQFTYGGNLCQTSAYGGETAYYDLGEEIFDWYAEKANLEITDFFYEDAQGETVDVEMHWDYEAKRGEFIMPDEDVTIYVIYHMWHKIPVGTFEHGYITADREQACTGQLVTYTVHPDPGWYPVKVFQRTPNFYYTRSSKQDENDRNIWTYTDDDVYDSGDLELVVQFEREPGWYSVNYTASENGTVSGAKDAKAGESVALNVQPAEGFELAGLSVTDAEGNPISVSNNTFIMPESDVTLSATFMEGSFVAASEPYIDEDGAYITGHVAHFAGADGTNYAINADGTIGEALESVEISHFTFKLRSDDTYQIDYYTGPAIEGQLVIPKTYNGKIITAVGNNDNKPLYGENKTQFELVLNENITTINPYAFYVLYVTKVIGDTSSLNYLGSYAFSWANSPSGYTLDLYLDYIGAITVGYDGFNHMKVTAHMSHQSTLSKNGSAQSVVYDFTDAHTFGAPAWTWAEDGSSASATFTCSDSRCMHRQSEQASISSKVQEGKRYSTASVVFDGQTYTDEKVADIHAENGVNLRLGSDITAHYYIDYQAYDGAAKIVYTYNAVNETEEHAQTTQEIDLSAIPAVLCDAASGRVKLTVSQAPAQMAELTHIEILDAEGTVLEALDYSAKIYCDKIIAMSEETLAVYAGSEEKAAQLKTLAHSLIAYAEAAQGLFANYETTKVTCEDAAVKEQIAQATATPAHTIQNDGDIRFTSLSFVCTKDARLRFYFSTEGLDYTPEAPIVSTGDAAIKYITRDGEKRYFVEVSGIDAADFAEQITVNYGGSAITCSALDYAGIVLAQGSSASATQQLLAKTLVVYNANALAYFGN